MVSCAAVFCVLLWAQYCLYGVFDDWWYLRFLLAAAPFVFTAIAACAATLSGSRVVGFVIVGAAIGAPAVVAFTRGYYVLDFGRSQSCYPAAARVVDRVTEPDSLILGMQYNGAVQYYSGRMTLRYDYLHPDWLKPAVAWLAERGHHPYALLEGWEVEAWRKRFGSAGVIGRLDLQPIRAIAGPQGLVLYDLLASGPEAPRTVAAIESDYDCRPPASPPPFSWSAPAR
jgi:hypothetical protein